MVLIQRISENTQEKETGQKSYNHTENVIMPFIKKINFLSSHLYNDLFS